MMKKTLALVALCGLVAGIAQGATVRYKSSGDWGFTTNDTANAYGWRSTSLPGIDDVGRLNWGDNTVTVNGTYSIGKLQVGVDEKGNLIIANGGTLTSDSSGAQNGDVVIGNGNNPAGTGTMVVQAGGTLNVGNILYHGIKASGSSEIFGTVNVASHLWTGWGDGGGQTGTININNGGILNVSGQLGLNWQNNGSAGYINVNDGGALNLAQLHGAGSSINGSSLLTIAEGGVVTKTANFVGVIDQYILDGKIVGEGGAPLSVVYDEGTDLTSITVIPEPATFGLMAICGAALYFKRRISRK
jgi:hypothetical protein